VALPNPPSVSGGARSPQRVQSITDMAYQDGRLFVAGLSNEEFSSKLRALSYPFTTADNGASVEIYQPNRPRVRSGSFRSGRQAGDRVNQTPVPGALVTGPSCR